MKALFLITSPLQALSAIDAIRFYKIDEFKFFVQSTKSRQYQITNVLKDNAIEYKCLPTSSAKNKISRLMMALFSKNQFYDYLFLGSLRFNMDKLIFSFNLKRGAKIIYIDDGNYIIPLFRKGIILKHLHHWVEMWVVNTVMRIKNISHNTFFTNYDGIHNPNFNVDYNPGLSINGVEFKNNDKVYFIGTSPTYAFDLGIENNYIKIVEECFLLIRKMYPNKTIVYIPHGNDNSDEIIKLCQLFHIEITKPSKCVELYLLDNRIKPLAVYGFGSSAQYTLKNWFKETENYAFWFGGSKNTEEIKLVLDYYSERNIKILDYTI